MERPRRSRRRAAYGALLAAATVCTVAGVAGLSRPAPLSPMEAACVGRWSYLRPDDEGTRIVYHFGEDRSVVIEQYHLTSAFPHVPRITMRGQWRVKPGGQLVVEKNTGLEYARDLATHALGHGSTTGAKDGPGRW